ncbi:MAG TPA: cation:proton antiporter [Bacilli bacterium]
MESSVESLTSLMIVVTLAFLAPVLLYKLRIRAVPVVVAEIIVGLMIGKSGFNFVAADKWLDMVSLLGFIFLMFLSGVEIDFSNFVPRREPKHRRKEFNPPLVAAGVFACMLILAYPLAYTLKMMHLADEPFLMMLIIATISLGVVVPVLKEKRLTETNLGQTLLLITVLSDFVTMILLAVFVGARSQQSNKMLLLLLFFVVVFAAYFVIRRIARGKLFAILAQSTVQIGTRATFALILLLVVLSDQMGADSILGAFLAGVIVALLSPKKEFVRQLDSFGYGFLIPIFFVMVGVNMELWSLFTDWKMIALILILLVFIFISKFIPALVLRKWFSWREVIGAGVLLSTELSLVIAAATIAQKMGIIDQDMYGALILVAVISSLIFPVLFSRIFPAQAQRKEVISIVGANHVSLPVAAELGKEGYEVRLFTAHAADEAAANEGSRLYKIERVANLLPETLNEYGAFAADGAVFATMEDAVNLQLANFAENAGVKNAVVRVENPQLHERLQREGVRVFSTLYASRTLLKAMIENPSTVKLIANGDDTIREVQMNNPAFHKSRLRDLPILGGVLVLRIFRGESFIVPHGNSDIQLGDRLLVSGDPESIQSLRDELE